MKGIVTVTPKSPGTLKVTVISPTESNPHRIRKKQKLIFEKPTFTVALKDTVEFDAMSGTEARVTRVLSPVPSQS